MTRRYYVSVWLLFAAGCVSRTCVEQPARPAPPLLRNATIGTEVVIEGDRAMIASHRCAASAQKELHAALDRKLGLAGYRLVEASDDVPAAEPDVHFRLRMLPKPRSDDELGLTITNGSQQLGSFVVQETFVCGTQAIDAALNKLLESVFSSKRLQSGVLVRTKRVLASTPRSSSQASSNSTQTILVLDLKALGDVAAHVPSSITKILLARLHGSRGLRTISSDDVAAMLTVEKQKDLLAGC